MGDNEVYMTNSYLQYRDDIELHRRKWDKCIRTLGRKKIIFAGDVNAKSTLWHNKTTDNKGGELEMFVEANDLDVCNKVTELKTFAGIEGEAVEEVNIDVTIKTRNVEIADWNIYEEGNSDHRLIIYTIKSEEDWNKQCSKGRFVLRKADWDLFQNRLESRIKQIEDKDMDLEEKILDLTTTIIAAAEYSIPRESKKLKTVCRWNRDLEIERRRIRKRSRKIHNKEKKIKKEGRENIERLEMHITQE